MKRFLLICAIFPLLLSAAFTGQWHTKAQAISASTHLPQTIGIYVNLTQTATGVAGTAATAGAWQSIQNVVVSDGEITFSIAEGGGTTSFALASLNNTLAGTVTLSTGQILPVTLTPVGQ